jgi:ATP-dependent helicase Lhr and Lhr-like helicase
MTSIDRLHPHLRAALGSRSFCHEHEQALGTVLDGGNTLVAAHDANGALEVVMLALLSRILDESIAPVAVLVVGPARQFACDRDELVHCCARMVGLESTRWNGRISDAKGKGFRSATAHVAMTNPELLDAMLINARTKTKALLGHLSAVVVDEVLEFAADDRGAHLTALLERIGEVSGRDFQRIGLSAAVGNPEALAQWLQGSSRRRTGLVRAPKLGFDQQLTVDFCEDAGGAVDGIARLAGGKKSAIFVDSRSEAERLSVGLSGCGIETSIHDGSVSQVGGGAASLPTQRANGEAIVCLPGVELGIQTQALDQIVQIAAPRSVSILLQRLWSAERGESTRPSCTCFCLTSESLLQSVALLRLAESAWVEDASPTTTAIHVLAHQVIALVLQDVGIPRHRLSTWMESVYSFSAIGTPQLQRLIDTMKAHDLLHESNGVLSLGQRGERQYGRPKFFELYAEFAAPAPALSTRLCQTMMNVLLTPEAQEQAWLSHAAALRLAGLRDTYSGVLEYGTAPLEVGPDEAIWYTFAGRAVNRLLALGLEQISGKKWVMGDLALQCRDITSSAASEALARIVDLDWGSVASDAAEVMARGMFGKLQPCLPEDVQRLLATERLLDVAGTARFTRDTRIAALPVHHRGARSIWP